MRLHRRTFPFSFAPRPQTRIRNAMPGGTCHWALLSNSRSLFSALTSPSTKRSRPTTAGLLFLRPPRESRGVSKAGENTPRLSGNAVLGKVRGA
jgi:hypothetical protein